MKEFIITIEVDDNITVEDIENGIIEMADNMATTECFYEIEETV